MLKQEVIKDNDQILAIILRSGDFPDGLNFYTKDQDFVQVSTWNYNVGKTTKPHAHKIAERSANRTQEVIYVKSGRMNMKIYNDKDEFFMETILESGDIAVIFAGGHSYEILEDKTQILETKNGPYPGLEKDKKEIK
ncbi:MAG: hypothetical protein Q7S70_00550 [bacterium]|nr:hypothetical protein [bacterium]